MRIVTITRLVDTGVQTQGELKTGFFTCKTLERPWKFNERKISCIPKGNYICKWTWSWKFARYTYEVINVKDRDGIRLHPGNYFFNVDGCILLGSNFCDLNKDGQKDILNTKETIKNLETFLGKQTFELIIN